MAKLLRILSASDRYMVLCGDLATLATSVEEPLRKCRVEGEGCDALEVSTEGLLQRHSELEKQKNELVAACDKWVRAQAKPLGERGDGNDLEYVGNLSNLVIDEYVNLNDRIVTVIVQKKLNELACADDHPMHKIIKSGYYAPR